MPDITNTYTNAPSKGLLTDLDNAYVGKEFWSHLRNGVNNTHEGNLGTISNEPSNKLCVKLPYTPIGFIKILNNRWVVFSTNDTVSEIGIFDESKCTYERVINNTCLGFKKSNLIKGVFKESFDCSEIIYWTDGVNPRRKLNITKVPYTYSIDDDKCKTKIYTNQLDCEALLISPNVQVPTITTRVGLSGNLSNGMYQVGIAYTVNQERITNFYSITSPQSIWSHENFGKSLDVEINNLDRDFDEYELVLIYTVKNTTTVKRIGFYSTSVSNHEISSADRAEYITIPLSEITLDRPYYFTADEVVSNDQYLLWSGVKSRPELNYQLQAMSIVSKWVMYQVDSDYYSKHGNKVGYYRDEVYSFGIQWLFKNGEWSNVYHIPGRKPVSGDTQLASGKDVFENADNGQTAPRQFEVTDTSRSKKRINVKGRQKPIAEGLMSYYESTISYPDNIIMFGDDACTPIRHHKFPSECTAPRYGNSGDTINILGVKFENIEHPKDASGNYIPDIVGYRIVRGDRTGNRSVIAKGVFTNVRSYKETLNQQGNNEEVLYSNYPFNDLRPDGFISSRQTYYRSGEREFVPLTTYKKDQFNFYSPGTLFSNVGLGDQIIFDTEEVADVIGSFEDVYNHPRGKALQNSVFWLAVAVGAIDGVLSVFGKRCVTSINDGVVNVTAVSPTGVGNVTYATAGVRYLNECETLLEGLRTRDILKLRPLEAIAKMALKTLQTAAKAGMGVYFAFKTANELIQTIEAFLPYQKYAMQYNGHAFYNSSKCVSEGNRRRAIEYYQNLYDGINVVEGVKFNNSKREKSTFVRLNEEIKDPGVQDTTRKTISEAGICDNIYKSFKSKSSLYYGAVKRRIPNQYGQLESITYLDTGYTDQDLINLSQIDDKIYKTDIIFGGDVYINRLSINKHHEFFRQNLSNANFPDGAEYDYTLYRNIGFPRFWYNSEQYDISEVLTVGKIPNRLPNGKHNFDCTKREGGLRSLNVKPVEGKFYLSSNGVMEFFVESEYNLDYRDYTTPTPTFNSIKYNNLSEIFRSDKWEGKEEFIYDLSFSKQLTENYLTQQRIDYDPEVDERCFTYYKNRVIYSQPAFREQRGDNWLIYLANNYYDFTMSDFGNLTSMQSIDNQQIMFLFDKSSPYVTIGRDELQTENGVKVTIGDGGLFARQPRPILYTDYAYGNSQSKFAFVNTQFGSFYPSQRQGRIFNYAGQLQEITGRGMHWWFKENLPSKLLEDFPNFKDKDNPVVGVGLISVFDNTDEKYYLVKKDYKLKEGVTLSYNPNTNKFSGGVKLGDPTFFDDASFTISYSPKDQAFISFHDWHPEWLIQGERHFMSVKDNTIWKHNERCDSFCNFYDKDYPFEIEIVVNNGQSTEVLRSVEYILEGGKYFNDCQDFHHILDENFDYAVVHNSEQISGYLRLVMGRKGDMNSLLDYPRLGLDEFIIRYDKEEQKTRFNQFSDIVKDRGEFTKRNYPLWTTEANGYAKNITDKAIDYNKSPYQKKKFRHTQHKILLIRKVSGDRKLIFKVINSKQVYSPR
jgi:hypothetical protein